MLNYTSVECKETQYFCRSQNDSRPKMNFVLPKSSIEIGIKKDMGRPFLRTVITGKREIIEEVEPNEPKSYYQKRDMIFREAETPLN